MRVIRAAPVGNIRVLLKEDNITVLVTLAVILRVAYLLLISELEANPAAVSYF